MLLAVTVPSGTHHNTHIQIPVTSRMRYPRNQPQGIRAVTIVLAPGNEDK